MIDLSQMNIPWQVFERNKDKMKCAFNVWRKSNPELYVLGLKDLCQRGQLDEVSELIQNDASDISDEIREMIMERLNDVSLSPQLVIKTFIGLKKDDELVQYLNNKKNVTDELSIEDVVFRIFLYYQEKSDYNVVFRLLKVLAKCDNYAILFNLLSKQNGLYHYRFQRKEEIAEIARLIWNRKDYSVLNLLVVRLQVGCQLADFLELPEKQIIDILKNVATKDSFWIIYKMISNDDYEDYQAHVQVLPILEDAKQTQDTLLCRWYHTFVAYKEGLLSYELLCDFIKNMPLVEDLIIDKSSFFMTVRVSAQILMEKGLEEHDRFENMLEKNNVFLRDRACKIIPYQINKNIKEEVIVHHKNILVSLYESGDMTDREFFEYYLNSHFKYIVKLGDVLGLIFSTRKESSENFFDTIHFRFYILKAEQNRNVATRKVVTGQLLDCLSNTFWVEVSYDKKVQEQVIYELVPDTYISKKTLSDGIRYRCLVDCGEKIEILQKPSPYDELFDVLYSIANKKKMDESDIERIRNVKCPELSNYYISRFYKVMARIMANSANQVNLTIQFLEALNQIRVNLCDLTQYPMREEKMRNTNLKYYREIVLACWKDKKYRKQSEQEELALKKKMVWVFMNSFMRFEAPLPLLMNIIRSARISMQDMIRYAFKDIKLYGSVNADEIDGDITPFSFLCAYGYTIHADKDIKNHFREGTIVSFCIKDFDYGNKKIIVSNVDKKVYDYEKQYKEILECEDLKDALRKYLSSNAKSQYLYSDIIFDWLATHKQGKHIYYVPLRYNMLFEAYYKKDENKFDFEELSEEDRYEIDNLSYIELEDGQTYTFTLSYVDVESKTLHFEL